MLIYFGSQEIAGIDPGVAKFGIALEWGSRGLEFESRHSDQKMGNYLRSFPFFILRKRFEWFHETLQWSVSRWVGAQRHFDLPQRSKCIESRHSDQKIRNSIHCSGFFLYISGSFILWFSMVVDDAYNFLPTVLKSHYAGYAKAGIDNFRSEWLRNISVFAVQRNKWKIRL